MHKFGFGGGCHWCTEAVFQVLLGIINVDQGWISSKFNFMAFSEAIIVEYDPKLINLQVLVPIHLYTHSCTSIHKFRTKYRSAIYTFNDSQKLEVQKEITKLQPQFNNPIITKVIPFVEFKPNLERYQNYYNKHQGNQFCNTYIHPKFKLLLKRFSTSVDHRKLPSLL